MSNRLKGLWLRGNGVVRVGGRHAQESADGHSLRRELSGMRWCGEKCYEPRRLRHVRAGQGGEEWDMGHLPTWMSS